MASRTYHNITIEGSYYDKNATAGFLAYLKRRGIEMYRYKVVASRKDYAYFSRDTLENHRREYHEEMEHRRKTAVRSRYQREVQDLESSLLGEQAPAAAKVPPDELEAAQGMLTGPPKRQPVDFDLLELLLPGYRSKDSKDFIRPADAPMYEPLPGPGWIRLLVIEPWCADSQRIRCHLRAIRLDDATGKYNALSYCWAQPTGTVVQDLACNGSIIRVGENLRLALQNIRYRTLPMVLWVDVLCINQGDLAERAQQVQMMGKIYEQAIETIVWLGDVFPPGPSLREFDAICRVVKDWDESLTPYYESRSALGKLCRHEPPPSRRHSGMSSQIDFDASLVSRLFRSPWFERRWVIQEVALARSVVVKVPAAAIQWRWIALAAGIIRTDHDRLISLYQMPSLYNAYLISRLSAHGPLPPLDLSLLSLLRLTTGFKTTEKLDVVFALLGFFNRQGESSGNHSSLEAIRVDYNLSESELGVLVAERHMAQSRRPLSFLSDAVGTLEKPTWSPRWTHKVGSMLDPWSLNDDSDAFNPAKGLSFKRFQSADPQQLKVEGVQLSQVAWRTPVFDRGEDFNFIMKDVIRMLQHCQGDWDFWNASAMPAIARAFCGERNRYGGRERLLDPLTTQFSDFIRDWLQCHPDDFPELNGMRSSKWFYSRSIETTWIDAAKNVCPGRCLFYTTSGHIGLGPGDTALSDVVCILGGAVMPIVMRPFGEHFGIVGDCYLNGVMDGEAVDDIVQEKALHGPVPVADIDRQAQSRYEPLQLRLISLC